MRVEEVAGEYVRMSDVACENGAGVGGDDGGFGGSSTGEDGRRPTGGPPLFTLYPLADDVRFGVLRRSFSGRINRVDRFVWQKLNPGVAMPADAAVMAPTWSITAQRWDLLLPELTPDWLRDPAALTASYEGGIGSGVKDLAVSIKLMVDDRKPLHHTWEAARDFVRNFLVVHHQLPTVMVLHDPMQRGYRDNNATHLHIVAMARKLTPAGWRETSPLAKDSAHAEIVDAWGQYRP